MHRRVRLVSLAASTAVSLASARLGPLARAQDARAEAAREEGKVVWYTSLVLPSTEKAAKLFEAACPGIKVEVHRTGSQRILQRVMQELQANIRNVDVIHISDAGHFVLLKDNKLLAKYTPAGVEGFPPGFKDKEPKTWKDLLDPRWKGKQVTAHPGYSGVIATHVLALVNLYGWDYFKQLAQSPVSVDAAARNRGAARLRRTATSAGGLGGPVRAPHLYNRRRYWATKSVPTFAM
jgi:iron(III) transport system substrate-binding protein